MKVKKYVSYIMFVLITSLTFQVNAGGVKDATWYLSMDIDQLRKNEIINILKGENIEAKIPQELSYMTVYGNSKGAEDATAVLKGDFSHFSIAEYLLNLLHEETDASQLIKERSFTYHNHEVVVIMVKDDGSNEEDKFKEIYFAKIDEDMSVISLDLNEVKNWIDDVYEDLDINEGSLFSVVVDVESALAHMGMNLDGNNQMMHSQIFKKVTQVSASVIVENDNLEIEIALSANEEAAAILIEQVINGLIAMNNLSNANERNELHAMLMQNISIVRTANNVLINTYVPTDELKKMDVHKHLNGEDKVEVKIKPLKFN